MASLPGIEIEGLFTHFARADETDKTFYREQYDKYLAFLGYLEEYGVNIPIRHCSNSAGIVEDLDSNHMDMVRAGICIYGLYPSDEVDRSRIRLTPIMEIKSFITYIKEIGPKTPVSYGSTFVSDKTMRVATILPDMRTVTTALCPIKVLSLSAESGPGSLAGSAWISLWSM
mgnify:CR=1 FL=1